MLKQLFVLALLSFVAPLSLLGQSSRVPHRSSVNPNSSVVERTLILKEIPNMIREKVNASLSHHNALISKQGGGGGGGGGGATGTGTGTGTGGTATGTGAGGGGGGAGGGAAMGGGTGGSASQLTPTNVLTMFGIAVMILKNAVAFVTVLISMALVAILTGIFTVTILIPGSILFLCAYINCSGDPAQGGIGGAIASVLGGGGSTSVNNRNEIENVDFHSIFKGIEEGYRTRVKRS